MMDLELPPPGLQSQQSDGCPLGGLLCVQTRRYKFWKEVSEHAESV
ncbi:nuclear factor erythroid 2-related factor 2 isoform 2 [Mus musculus]|nr:nuclear factor erythroid 2-related factor 2 isoform 2 [Mus musculus]EDL27192.1 nuclear factor, erythroid derived 2, like 2, isoform CRA_a [Mus musculus]